MNTDQKYNQYALCREMLDTVDVAKNFDVTQTKAIAAAIAASGRLMMTGEGSSRIFPAKNAIRKALTWGLDVQAVTDGSRQAMTYDLAQFAILCASNSGRTKEVILLAKKMAAAGNKNVFGVSANAGTLLEAECAETIVLKCGWENAVAATKSVVEQGLVYQAIMSQIAGRDMTADLAGLAEKMSDAMTAVIDPAIIDKATKAETIYFAGYNDGVAEELTLKTNEITRKKSDFLEGTYAAHGVEEVMDASDVVFVIDPIEEEIAKFQEVLVQGVGLTIVAIADRDTPFPTIKVGSAGEMAPFVYLAAGWNVLVEIGLALSIDLDKPERARKVGNDIEG